MYHIFHSTLHHDIIASQWSHASPDAINLVSKMLAYLPEKRITAEQALNDIWIMKFTHSGRVGTINMLESMQQLQKFKARSGLQKAVLSYMTGRFISTDQEKKAREVFEMLDVNGDGQLSKGELLNGYKILLNGDIDTATKEVEDMMSHLDMNRNGTIDYRGISSSS